ncbi:MAG: ABC transporter ATP-binding protein [Elusimicrobiales bacterium]
MIKALEVANLTKKYTPQAGVENLSFSIASGEVLAYIGHNGAGKTTTIRTLLGLLKSDSGEIKYFGKRYDTYAGDFDALRGQLGVCLDNPGFYPNLSALKNLALFGELYGVCGAEFSSRAEELLKKMALHHVRNDRVQTFSKGMRQKLALVRAMLHKPKLIFLDEPMTGLDPAARVLMRETVRELAKEQGVSFFLASHDLNEVEQLADNIIILEKGRIKQKGTLAELQNARSVFSYTLVPDKPVSPEVLEKLRSVLACAVSETDASRINLSATTPVKLARVVAEFAKENIEILEFHSAMNLEQIYFESLRRE